MDIAFYAPMKSPDHPVPSGDREMARLIIKALEHGGHSVRLASEFRSWMRAPDALTFEAMEINGREAANRLLFEWADKSHRPSHFITYHLYHKAPDYIGPHVSEALGIPYIVIEASRAKKHETSAWAPGLRIADTALLTADKVLAIHQNDLQGLVRFLPADKTGIFPPFLDAARYSLKPQNRQYPLQLITAAMMREGDKMASYKLLAKALRQVEDLDWQISIAGDGPCRAVLEGLFPKDRTVFAGQLNVDEMQNFYHRGDLFVWPAINEAYGMVLLEAQASGLPVVAGDAGGVSEIIDQGKSGFCGRVGDLDWFSQTLRAIVKDPFQLKPMSQQAYDHIREKHDLPIAAARLNLLLEEVSGQ